MSYTGEILQAPERSELARLARTFELSGAESIAISTLFSFANPANESAMADVLEELGAAVVRLARNLPEFREYERASTVVINAYLQPLMQRYLNSLRTASLSRTQSIADIHHAVERRYHGAGIGGAPAGAHRALRTSRRNYWRDRDGKAQRLRPTSSPSTWEARRPMLPWYAEIPSRQ